MTARQSSVESSWNATLDLRLVGHVAGLRQHATTMGLEPLLRDVVLLPIRAPDRDARAGPGQRLGHAEPDPAIAAGDQSHLARQIEIARIGCHGVLPIADSITSPVRRADAKVTCGEARMLAKATDLGQPWCGQSSPKARREATLMQSRESAWSA
jgi:hypothetical protein